MNAQNPIQEQLFLNVIKKFRNRSAAIADYQRNFPGSSHSTARSRFAGVTAITYDHGMEIAAHYGLHDFDILPAIRPDTYFLSQIPSVLPDIDSYLDFMVQDFTHLRKEKNVVLQFAISDYPLILLKRYKTLAGFMIYFALNIEQQQNSFPRNRFGIPFFNEPSVNNWLEKCKFVYDCYQLTQSIEYWSTNMFNHLLIKIHLLKQLGLMDSPKIIDDLYSDLINLVNDLETAAQKGKKIIINKFEGAPIQVFNHEGLISPNLMIAESSNIKLSYIEYGPLNIYRNTKELLVDQQKKRIEKIGRIGGEVGNINLQNRDFFHNLKTSITAKMQ
jgi:hypothetical protein